MTDAQLRIQVLIQSSLRYFEAHRRGAPGVALLLDKIASMDLHENQLLNTAPQGTRHEAILTNAIAGVTSLLPVLTWVSLKDSAIVFN